MAGWHSLLYPLIQLSCFNKASHRLWVSHQKIWPQWLPSGMSVLPDLLLGGYTWLLALNLGHFASQGTRGQVCKHVGDAFWEQPSMLLTQPTMPTTVPQRTISPNAQCWIERRLYLWSPSWWTCFFSPKVWFQLYQICAWVTREKTRRKGSNYLRNYRLSKLWGMNFGKSL